MIKDLGFTTICALCGKEIHPHKVRLIYFAEGDSSSPEDIYEFCEKHNGTYKLRKKLEEIMDGKEDNLEDSESTSVQEDN